MKLPLGFMYLKLNTGRRGFGILFEFELKLLRGVIRTQTAVTLHSLLLLLNARLAMLLGLKPRVSLLVGNYR
jgi:hypothetical protein